MALVFLVLAALYESWSQPLAVILVVPLCILGAIVGLAIAKLPIDILAQVGLVVLVGLASKNAILIVEFARELVSHGQDIRTATLTACRLRLRPIRRAACRTLDSVGSENSQSRSSSSTPITATS